MKTLLCLILTLIVAALLDDKGAGNVSLFLCGLIGGGATVFVAFIDLLSY